MNCRNIVKCYLSIFVAFSLTPQPKVFAQSNPMGCQATLYEFSNTADIQKLTAADIIGPNNVEQIGNNLQQLPTTSPYKSSATKDVARYWQIRVKNSDLPINASNVRYRTIISFQDNNPFQKNMFEPKAFGTIEQIEQCSDQTTVIAGGISLEFKELSKLVPGQYRGEINVCLPINGNQCN